MTPEIRGAYRRARRVDLEAARAVFLAPTPGYLAIALVAHEAAHRVMVRARRRLVLSALAHLVAAATIIGVLYGLIVLMWAAFGADPAPAPDFTPVQLPTL